MLARTLLCSLVALAAPEEPPRFPHQWLAGVSAGIAQPPLEGASAGPYGSLSAELAFSQRFAAHLALDQSWHHLTRRAVVDPLLRTAATLGVSYRLDVTVAVPFLTLGLRGSHYAVGPAEAFVLDGVLAVGLHVPLGQRWFAAAEARYGYELASGAFPFGQAYGLRLGWRSGPF